jgi:spore coat polysaccharide biosynthesis protein SpsF
MTKQLNKWRGEFGDEYTRRNDVTGPTLEQRKTFWSGVMIGTLPKIPMSILEIGANTGANLTALHELYGTENSIELYAVEPNDKAKKAIPQDYVKIIDEDAFCINRSDYSIDMVFTCGVLIHIHPDNLLAAMKEIYRVSREYIICAEYFSPKCEEIHYRGEDELLWKNDFGSIWLDNFPLHCVICGFGWKRVSGMDNLTFQVFRKVN